eukprot:CAMPEP_0201488802 /NCGR_PEP_ID=MMETSP0151_2-20130828/19416_1 /ASSEMBLY_ACC=CAM_ASM_000257 /TAXON_ID=200890 /ORGANISM="Paramoeba atlantica, Strain 621/1 / CCAP 1560/9" /LENGTH=106 /DNA_ID=CAMNT_0047874161 /DNA_START=8 /DNA_END=325 /DNA_ORIENTATION=-
MAMMQEEEKGLSLEEKVRKIFCEKRVKEIVFIRHGKTDKALDSSIEADLARKLTKEGEEMCEKAGKGWFSKRDFDLLFCSPAGRVIDTLQLMKQNSSSSSSSSSSS